MTGTGPVCSARKLAVAAAAGVAGLLVLLLLAFVAFTMIVLPAATDGLCTGPGGAPGHAGPGTTGAGSGSGWGSRPTPNGDQLSYAQLITSVVASRGLPEQAAIVAIAAARQESALGQAGMNTALDHDSLGLFQQRPSAGWGTPAQVKDPTYATNTFLDHLTRIAGWAAMPVTQAAQQVQGSAFPGAYAHWETLARGLAAKFWSSAGAPAAPPPTPGAPAPAPQPVAALAPGAQPCPGNGGDGTPAPGSAGTAGGATAGGAVPGGGTTATAAAGAAPTDPQQAGVVATALAQLGKPYQWGGTGPAAFDCSGLTLTAWRAAGVSLPRTTAAQAGFGAPVTSTAALQPGDLIFIAGSDGTAAAPGHVGLYVGGGRLVHAPQQSEPVQIVPVARWQSQIVTMRRPTTAHPDAPTTAVNAADPTQAT